MKKKSKIRFIVEAAVIGAIYAVITLLFAPISYGMFQLRISEALTILPALTFSAVPGLFVGCLAANILGGNGPLDIIFGSLATLTAAYLSYKMPKKSLVPLPPIIVNALVIGIILSIILEMPLYLTVFWVGAGQAAACYGLGYPLLLKLNKYKHKLFS